jgi:hypothetical protein
MKTKPAILLVSVAPLISLWLALSPGAYGQASSQSSSWSSGGSSSIAAFNTNGQTVVIFNGKQVYAGPTESERVGCRTASANGATYAAAFAGDKLLWENSPGAAQQLSGTNQPAMRPPAKSEPPPLIAGPQTGTASSSQAAISVRTDDKEAVVVYNGREFRVPTVQGSVTAKAKSIDGVGYAAAFDGDQVLWENVPGAAEKVR